jgi:two-component system response regulator MtrA
MIHRGAILIVEDDYATQDFLVELLGDEGYEVRAASTAADARAALLAAEPDLLLCDYWLPDGSGFVLAGELRQIGVTVPIVLMSGDNWSVHALDQSLIAGCLLKPFSVDALLTTIEMHIRNRPS